MDEEPCMCDMQYLQTLNGQRSGLIELLELCFRCIQAIQENELPKVTRFDNLTKQAFFCNTLSMVETLQRHKFQSVFIISPRGMFT